MGLLDRFIRNRTGMVCALALCCAAAAPVLDVQDADARGRRSSFGRSFIGGMVGGALGSAAWDMAKGSVQAEPGNRVQAAAGDFPEGWRGNRRIADFRTAKRILKSEIFRDDHRTLYCGAEWSPNGAITQLPEGFETPAEQKRAARLEWEHAVPAENFGRAFPEWREGAQQCVKDGRYFKGRKCAETNPLFSLMEADMHNLHPSIGAVNALRSNYRYVQFGKNAPNTFGTCAMKIDPQGRAAEPPDEAKGRAARSTLYMEYAYPSFKLSDQQRRLMEVWDREFPPDRLECTREQRIKKIQGNGNPFVERACNGGGSDDDDGPAPR